VADASSVSDATAEIVRAQLREHGASTEAMPGRRIALNTDRPLEMTLEEPRRELGECSSRRPARGESVRRLQLNC
jgi:hypothetical protein